MCEERATPCSFGIARRAADDLRSDASDRSTFAVNQACLAGQQFTVVGHAHHVSIALANSRWGNHRQVAGVTIDLRNVLAQSPSCGSGVKFSLDHNATTHNVQRAAESK